MFTPWALEPCLGHSKEGLKGWLEKWSQRHLQCSTLDSAPLSSRQVSEAGFPSHQGSQHSFGSPASVLMPWPAQEASAGSDTDVSQQTQLGRNPESSLQGALLQFTNGLRPHTLISAR